MVECPICQKNCGSRIGLISHIYWRHYKNYTLVIAIISFILGITITILITTNTENIDFLWDKYVLDKESDLYISINAISILDNQIEIEKLGDEKKVEFLNEFTKIGIIPPWHDQKRPKQINIVDELTNDQDCLFFAFDSANRFAKEEDLPIDLKNQNKKFRDITFLVPTRETIEYLKETCPLCLAYEIYGISKGNRDIDLINFQVCFPDENYIVKVSDDIIQDGDHCIRIKKENIVEKEDFLGVVFVENNKEPLYWDLWDNPLRNVNGKYSSKGKDFYIKSGLITRIISGIVPLCHF